MKNLTKKTIAIALISSFIASTSLSAYAADVTLKNNTYVSISGKLTDFINEDSFHMQYWGGEILVDTNDGRPDLFTNNMKSTLAIGDRIIVSGIVDNNTFSENEIDARKIDVLKGDMITTYDGDVRTSKVQNADLPEFYSGYNLSYINDDTARVSGYITEVPNKHQFVLSYGPSKMLVELNDLKLNKSVTFITGDFVIIDGKFNKDLFNSTIVTAATITKVSYYKTVN
jgi:uncharacterized protein YdeI (BOF family)